MNNFIIISFVFGIIIGILLSYLFYKKFKKNNVKLFNNIPLSECLKPNSKEDCSYILQINPSQPYDYYEVSVYDKKDNLLYIKNNISQLDLSSFKDHELKYKVFSPSNESIQSNVYKVPKLLKTFNAPSLNTSTLKSFSPLEIEYQTSVIDKLLDNHQFIVKKEIEGKESTKYDGTISRKIKIFISENDFLGIGSGITKIFLVYPSYGILTENENIELKNNLHENFNIKIDEIRMIENKENLFTISCIVPLIGDDSELPNFKMIFV